ncbi:hypothetical protein [Nodularia spumigena]|nr:hypothetical protein [Nodularia spumigena]MDB9325049.1 hypothetical protein [Nodularia spumigena CS-590/02]MDB9342846.1 hypothetical protein [Nodularia spumigena CS-588/06]MDB9371115.1 hypothetical protein [Nodularia spumigena CS-586/05]
MAFFGYHASHELFKQFEAIAQFVKPEDMYKYVRISADPQQHIDWLQQDIELGFNEIYLHNLNRKQENFIEVFGKQVIPALEKEAREHRSAGARGSLKLTLFN